MDQAAKNYSVPSVNTEVTTATSATRLLTLPCPVSTGKYRSQLNCKADKAEVGEDRTQSFCYPLANTLLCSLGSISPGPPVDQLYTRKANTVYSSFIIYLSLFFTEFNKLN